MNSQGIQPAVWAPEKQRVGLFLSTGVLEMQPCPRRAGWWRCELPLPAGTRYGFLLDGEGPFPDPRSASQPDGVHGLSELVDHSQFRWTDAAWSPPPWEEAVAYELHIGTVSDEGTFQGLIRHLDALQDLGITHIELMPVCEFPGSRGWGYDGVSLFAPHHAYGGVDGLKTLIDACHSRGLAAIIDVVYNHLGPDGNYLPTYGPYFTDRHVTPWGDAPNFDGPRSAAEVRAFFVDNALMWLGDYHADGLRLDAIDKVIDTSEKHFLLELSERVRNLEKDVGRKMVLIAESAMNDPKFVLPAAKGGYGLDAQWNDDLHHSMRTVFTGERDGYFMDYQSAEDTAKALRQGFVLDGRYSPYRKANHGKPPTGLKGSAFIGYIQNHDQIGNRATGDRFHHHPAVDTLHHQMAAAFVLLAPFVPMIFMGEEWAASSPFQYFTDHQDPVLAMAVSDGRKREFGVIGWRPEDIPDPQHEQAFLVSKLRWQERDKSPHAELLSWYRSLLKLRRDHPEFGTSRMSNVETAGDPDGHWLWMRRDRFLVVAAMRGAMVDVPVSAHPNAGTLLSAGCLPVFAQVGIIRFNSPGLIILENNIP